LSDDHIDRAIEAIDTGKSDTVTPETHTADETVVELRPARSPKYAT
jgi:hypothetical protein